MYGTMEAWLLFSCVAALCGAMWAIFDRKKKKNGSTVNTHSIGCPYIDSTYAFVDWQTGYRNKSQSIMILLSVSSLSLALQVDRIIAQCAKKILKFQLQPIIHVISSGTSNWVKNIEQISCVQILIDYGWQCITSIASHTVPAKVVYMCYIDYKDCVNFWFFCR